MVSILNEPFETWLPEGWTVIEGPGSVYYSHWFQKKESKVFKDIRLDYLSRDANLLLEMCLISQMGFDDSEIVKMVTNNRFYHNYLCIDRPEGNNVFSPSRIVWKKVSRQYR